MRSTLRLLALGAGFATAFATSVQAQSQPRNELWVRLGASLPQSTLALAPWAIGTQADLRVWMANAFAGGVTVSRLPPPGSLVGWRVTGLIVPSVELRGTSDRYAPGTLYGMSWGTGYYLSAEVVPQRSLGRASIYGVIGAGTRRFTIPNTSCVPEDLACEIGVGGPQEWAALANVGAGASVTVGAYTFGAEVVSQLSQNRRRLEHDVAVLGTLKLLAW